MNDRYESILKAALALPEAERVFLIDELMDSLPPDTGPLSDEEMLAELERRHAEYEKDPSSTIPWEEVKRSLGWD
ncbi:MAG TPA: addiction module protein [Gemmataceae bacterium]|nr:addiction module protein [Gemmataceae bacterium]